jgi:hypothetical protein
MPGVSRGLRLAQSGDVGPRHPRRRRRGKASRVALRREGRLRRGLLLEIRLTSAFVQASCTAFPGSTLIKPRGGRIEYGREEGIEMQWRSDKFLGVRILLYAVIMLGGTAIANYAFNNGHVIMAAIAFVLAVGSLPTIGAIERLVQPRGS